MFKSFTTSQTKPTSYREEIIARKRLYKPPVTQNLQLWFDTKMTRGSVVYDKSTFGRDGDIYNGAVVAPNNNYISFDGLDDYVKIDGYSIERDFPEAEMSAFAIVRWNGQFTRSSRKHIFGCDNGGHDWQFGTQNNYWHIFNGVAGVSSSTAADTNWHILYATWQPSGCSLYLDGTNILNTSDIAFGSTSPYVNIGASTYLGVSEYWTGDIASVLIYDRALSDRELQYNYELLRARIPNV